MHNIEYFVMWVDFLKASHREVFVVVDFWSYRVFKILFRGSFGAITLVEVDLVSDIALDGTVIIEIWSKLERRLRQSLVLSGITRVVSGRREEWSFLLLIVSIGLLALI